MTHKQSPNRYRVLRDGPKQTVSGNIVVYRMSRDQRVQDNQALLYAQQQALEMKLPLVVWFHASRPTHRTQIHIDYMRSGLGAIARSLATYQIGFIHTSGSFQEGLHKIMHLSPALLVWDFSPLRGLVSQQQSAQSLQVPSVVVDTHNIIPVWSASTKQEWSAYTLRRKLEPLIPHYLIEPERLVIHPFSFPRGAGNQSEKQSGMQNDREEEARRKLIDFIQNKLHGYTVEKNDPTKQATSGLSSSLHFGHISALRVALEINKAATQNPRLKESAAVFLEELIVRKELADNFCFYNNQYDSFAGAPEWAQKTLLSHRNEIREWTYTYTQFEQGETHDPAWNAAQRQMVKTGYMHGYMRMYWAKKILEWTTSPEEAVSYAVRLNDTYELDGHDPNGYAGILWSIAGLHDRPWFERPVFGTVRYMNANGLSRKFNIKQYIEKWD